MGHLERTATGVSRALNAARRMLDDRRIASHLRRVEHDLRAADHDHLTAAQRRRRERSLDRLRAYRRRGEFPRNETHPGRTPCFVGATRTRCAVAHLLAAAGHDDLVADVAATDNTVRVEALDGGPVVERIEDLGLTRAEAARIQPTYPEGVHLATTCGPVSCRVAAALASLVGIAAFALAEVVGYRLVADLFPGNALKRRGLLAYATVLNLLLAPLLAALVYALFP